MMTLSKQKGNIHTIIEKKACGFISRIEKTEQGRVLRKWYFRLADAIDDRSLLKVGMAVTFICDPDAVVVPGRYPNAESIEIAEVEAPQVTKPITNEVL